MPQVPDIRAIDFRRILLIKPSAVGDVVHTLPVLEKLRRRYPAARIDWLLTPENAELVRGHPALSNILLFARRQFSEAGRRLGSAGAMLALVRDIQAARYELVLDLHGQLRSGLFALASGAPVRIGFARPVSSRAPGQFRGKPLGNTPRRGWAGAREGSWLAYTHHIPIPTLQVHAVDRYIWAGPLLGLDNQPPEFHLPANPEADSRVGRMLAGRSSPAGIALLAPGSMWETKQWRADGFAEVALELLRRGMTVILTGGKRDQALSTRIRAAAPGALDVTGQTSLADLVALTRRAALIVTNDSGPMHIAAALGRPAISIFGPTNPLQVGPYRQDQNVVRLDLSCSPCNFRRLRQCPFGHRCMRDLPAQAVLDAIGQFP